MEYETLRTTFNNEAELYNAARPHYPKELFEALIKETSLPKDAHLLEIGPGTGQATHPLAQRGYNITAIELGQDLAEVAKRELREFPNVEVICSSFEDVHVPDERFDLVYSATAFHWIEDAYKFSKPHRILKPGGHLAIIRTHHVSDEGGDAFFHAVQPIYKKYQKEHFEKDFQLPHTKDIQPQIFDESLFFHVYFGQFPLVLTYSATEYTNLLRTFSPTISMNKEVRGGFLRDIQLVIQDRFDGVLEKHFSMSLSIGRKI